MDGLGSVGSSALLMAHAEHVCENRIISNLHKLIRGTKKWTGLHRNEH